VKDEDRQQFSATTTTYGSDDVVAPDLSMFQGIGSLLPHAGEATHGAPQPS
jgi:hypothetical protein